MLTQFPIPKEAGINPKADTGTPKEREREKEKEKDKRKVAKEMGNQAKARAKGQDPKMDVGYVVDPTTHPIAPKASPKEKGKQDPHMVCLKMKVHGIRGVRVQKREHQKCDHYQDYRQS